MAMASECLKVVEQVGKVEEEKTVLATECKTKSIELEKRIGALRIKITVRANKLRHANGNNKLQSGTYLKANLPKIPRSQS